MNQPTWEEEFIEAMPLLLNPTEHNYEIVRELLQEALQAQREALIEEVEKMEFKEFFDETGFRIRWLKRGDVLFLLRTYKENK